MTGGNGLVNLFYEISMISIDGAKGRRHSAGEI